MSASPSATVPTPPPDLGAAVSARVDAGPHYVQVRSLIVRVVGDAVLACAPVVGALHAPEVVRLTASARDVFAVIEEPGTVDDVVARLASAHGIDAADQRAAIAELLAAWARSGIAEVRP